MNRIEKRFADIDKNGDGMLDFNEFSKELPRLGIQWEKAKIKEVLARIAVGNKETVNLKEFKSACYMACLQQPDLDIDTLLKMVLNRMVAKGPMDQAILQGGKGSNGRSNLVAGMKKVEAPSRTIVEEEIASKIERKFTEMDENFDGLIDFNEFAASVKTLGLNWSDNKIETVLKSIGDKTINFQQFKAVLQAACAANPTVDVNTIFRTTLINLSTKANMNAGFRENKIKRMMNAVDSKFDEIDLNKDGALDLKEFTSAVAGFGLDWDEKTIDNVLTRIDSDGNGTIERVEFRTAFLVACMKDPEQDLNDLIGNTLEVMAAKGVMSKDLTAQMKTGLKEKLNKVDAPERKVVYEEDAVSRIQQKFVEMDIDKDGSINIKEFGKALKDLGLRWQENTVTTVLNDVGANGEIGFNQFRGVLDAACNANPDASIDMILKTTLVNLANKTKLNNQFNNDELKKKVKDLDGEFKKRDTDSNGELDIREFADACTAWGLDWSPEQTKQILSEIGKKGKIDLTDFKRLFSLAASKNPNLDLQDAIRVTLEDLARRSSMNAAFAQNLKGGFNLAKRKTKVKDKTEEDAVSKIASKFQEMDIDQDGALNIEEFSKGIQSLGIKWPDYKIRGVLRKIDTDQSGDISFTELGQILYAAVHAFPTKSVDDILRSALTSYAAKSGINEQFRDVAMKKMISKVENRFAELDKNKDGQLDLAEFTSSVKSFGLQWTEDEIKGALDKIDTDNSGTISAQEFKSALYMACVRNSDTGVDAIMEAVLQRMQTQNSMNFQLGMSFPKLKKVEVKRTQKQEDAMSKIEIAFARVDINKDGVLTPDELAATTKALGLNWDEKECSEFISRIDLDGTGKLSMFDFAHVCGAAASKNPKASVEDIIRSSLTSLAQKREVKAQMREQALKSKMRAMDKIFKELDTNKDGQLDLAEFTGAIKRFNLSWSDAEIQDCLGKIDANNNGFIERNEYQAAFYNAAIKNPDLQMDEIITCALESMMAKGQMNARFSSDFNKISQSLKKVKKVVVQPAKYSVVSAIEEKFMMLDQNLDGVLSYKEFADTLKNIGLTWGDEKIKEVMSRLDSTGSNKITFGDFKPVMFKTATRHPDWTVDQVLRTALANLASQKGVNVEISKRKK